MTTPSARPAGPAARPPARTRPAGWFYPLLLIVVGVAAHLVRDATADVHTATRTQRDTLDAVRRVLGQVGPWLIAGGVALGVLLLAWATLRPGRRRVPGGRSAREVTVLAAAGAALHTAPDRLTLHRAKWRRRRTLTRARIGYPPGAVVSDHSAALAEAIAPFATAPVAVRWHPTRHRFHVEPYVPPDPRLEDRFPALARLAERLSFIMGDPVTVDQATTSIEPATGAVQRLVATYATTTRDLGDGFRERVQAVLDAKAPSPTGYWSLAWNPELHRVTITPAQPLPRLADYPLTAPAAADLLRIPIGVTEGGQAVSWHAETAPHMLLAGPTGTGKTIALNSILIGAAARGWDCYLADPKELSFRGMAGWPGIRVIATTDEQMEAVTDAVWTRMRARYAQLKVFGVRESDLTPVLLVVDEAGEMVERLNAYHTSHEKQLDLIDAAIRGGEDPDTAAKLKKPTGTKNPELMKLWSLLRLGRQARVFVIIATQRPDVTFVPGEARDNMRTRMALGSLSGTGLEMVFENRSIRQRVIDRHTDPATGLTRLVAVRGRATIGELGAGIQAVQTFWVPDPAKLRTGELTPADAARVEACLEFVTDCRASLGIDDTRPPADPAGTPAGRQLDPRYDIDVDADLDVADAERPADPADLDLDLDGLPTVPAGRLHPGMTVALDVDGRTTLAVVEELTTDPADPDRVEITYRIAGDHPAHGQAGVTTYDDTEAVPVAEDLPDAA